jgi:hypothetical protein
MQSSAATHSQDIPSPRVFFSLLFLCLGCCAAASSQGQGGGLWVSAAELKALPMTGCAWERVSKAADKAQAELATVSDGKSDNNVEILAAAIVYARTGLVPFRSKVVAANERLVAGGKPAGKTLPWAREVGAYVLAADLVGYRTESYELWLRNMAEVWVGEEGRTLLQMFEERPNNWGTMAIGSLVAIYAYLGDQERLVEIRSRWQRSVEGPLPEEVVFGKDRSWHADPDHPLLINPPGATKKGLDIDGIVADDMRRNGPFSNPPPKPTTSYHWETLQGMVMAARIYERLCMPIWDVGHKALYRAVHVLQDVWGEENASYKASGDDLWMLPFLDQAYGTSWSAMYEPCESRLFKSGKNVGWPWIILGQEPVKHCAG